MSSYNYRKNKGYESEPRSVSKKKSNNILISVVTVCVLLLAVVGAMGYFTGGFVTWDGTATAWAAFKNTVTGWFSPAAVEDDYLHKFKDFTKYEYESGVFFYVLDIDSYEWEDMAAGDSFVIVFDIYLDGELIDDFSYELDVVYAEDIDSFVVQDDGELGLPGFMIIFDYEFDGIGEDDFPFVSAEGSYVIVVIFAEVEGYDSFNIISIIYVPAEE